MIGLVFWIAAFLAAYTYAGYPVLVSLLASRRGDPTWSSHTPKVTLVIAACDEEAVIAGKLRNTLALDYPPELLQVIVAADGSTDSTVDIAADFPVEIVHRSERAGKMAALERAVAWATGEVLVFSDANNMFGREALRTLVAPFSDPGVGVVTGRKTVTGGDAAATEGLYWKYESHLRRMETRLGCTVGVNGEILAVRSEVFAPAPPGTINDDQWLAHRAVLDGWDVVYAPGAVSVEEAAASSADDAERRSRIVAGQFQVFRRLRTSIPWRRPRIAWMLLSHKVLRPVVPLAMLAMLASAAAAAAVPPRGGAGALGAPWGAAALGAQLAFYLVGAGGDRLPGPAGRLGRAVRFLIIQQAASLRGWWRHITVTQPANWRKTARGPT